MKPQIEVALSTIAHAATVFANNEPERRDECHNIERLLREGKTAPAHADLRKLCTAIGTGHNAHDQLKIALDRLDQLEPEAPAPRAPRTKARAKKKPAKKAAYKKTVQK